MSKQTGIGRHWWAARLCSARRRGGSRADATKVIGSVLLEREAGGGAEAEGLWATGPGEGEGLAARWALGAGAGRSRGPAHQKGDGASARFTAGLQRWARAGGQAPR